MNQRTIFIIVVMLGLAVIGVMTLQMRFINETYRANEIQFDSQISNMLSSVAARLQSNEEDILINGYSDRGQKALGQSTKNIKGDTSQESMAQLSLVKRQTKRSLEERLNITTLNVFLKHELEIKKIKVPYNYGVFSVAKNAFITYNAYYVIPEENTVGLAYLLNSSYKTILFSNSPKVLGYLYIQFPTKNAIVWGGLWTTLAASIFFTLIILGCFAYTINVILHQKKLSEMKTDFINNMTHEFKTPIATISIAADSIVHKNIINNSEKIQRFADIIRQENRRMNAQVEKVLQMALIDREELKLNLSPVNLNEVVQQAVGNAVLQVEKKEGNVRTDLRAEMPTVEGDRTHIESMINNLLDNANKYSPEQPDILVSTRNVPNGVAVTVTDKGIGMTATARKHIFDKFYRVHTGNLHDVKGFGLGLTYVKTMMTAHKGQIDVRSELGKGSSFTLVFPFQVAAPMN